MVTTIAFKECFFFKPTKTTNTTNRTCEKNTWSGGVLLGADVLIRRRSVVRGCISKGFRVNSDGSFRSFLASDLNRQEQEFVSFLKERVLLMEAMFDGQVMQKGLRYGPDSLLLPNFLSEEEASALFESSRHWSWMDRNDQRMSYRGKPMPRTNIAFVAGTDDDCMDDLDGGEGLPEMVPRFKYSGFQYGGMLDMKTFRQVPEVGDFARMLNERFCFRHLNDDAWQTPSVNHIIGTTFEDSTDNIGFHNDRPGDIVKGSVILMAFFGERREMHLRNIGEKQASDVIVMEPGSLFILGPQTNETMQHSVVPLTRERRLGLRKEVGPCMTLVLRNVCTMMTKKQVIARCRASDKARETRKRKRTEKSTAEMQLTLENNPELMDVLASWMQSKRGKMD